MTAPSLLSTFPWRDLARIERAAIPALNNLVQDLTGNIDRHRFSEVDAYLSTVFKRETSLSIPRPPRPYVPHPSHFPNASFALFNSLPELPRSISALVILEAGLAHALVTTVLSSPYLWPSPNRPAPQPVHEACGAMLLAAGRRLNLVPEFQLRAVGQAAWSRFHDAFAPHPYRVIAVDGNARVGQATYGWRVHLYEQNAPTRRQPPAFDGSKLQAMGSTPLAISLLGAECQTSRQVLASLNIGDAWLPGDDWLVNLADSGAGLTGQTLLYAPGGDTALKCFLHPDGTIVVGDEVIAMQDTPNIPPDSGSVTPEHHVPSSPGIAVSTIADAPLLVRVEIGAVSLTAEQWAHVAPGTVLATGHPVGQQVILRVADVEVGRGELVNIEGELGVRIQSLTTKRRTDL